jgi:hypothetical protein
MGRQMRLDLYWNENLGLWKEADRQMGWQSHHALRAEEAQATLCPDPYRISPSSAALQNVLGHMGAVAMRFTRFV